MIWRHGSSEDPGSESLSETLDPFAAHLLNLTHLQRLEDLSVIPGKVPPAVPALVLDCHEVSSRDPDDFTEKPFAARVNVLKDCHGEDDVEGLVLKGPDGVLCRRVVDPDVGGHFGIRVLHQDHGILADSMPVSPSRNPAWNK